MSAIQLQRKQQEPRKGEPIGMRFRPETEARLRVWSQEYGLELCNVVEQLINLNWEASRGDVSAIELLSKMRGAHE